MVHGVYGVCCIRTQRLLSATERDLIALRHSTQVAAPLRPHAHTPPRNSRPHSLDLNVPAQVALRQAGVLSHLRSTFSRYRVAMAGITGEGLHSKGDHGQ